MGSKQAISSEPFGNRGECLTTWGSDSCTRVMQQLCDFFTLLSSEPLTTEESV